MGARVGMKFGIIWVNGSKVLGFLLRLQLAGYELAGLKTLFMGTVEPLYDGHMGTTWSCPTERDIVITEVKHLLQDITSREASLDSTA